MKRRIISILVMFVFWVPVITCAEDAMRGEVMLPNPANTTSQASSTLIPKEWYIVAKLPTGKGLAIGVFWIQEGMPIEHICSILGNPQDTITPGMEECYGTILVYPNYYFLFSRTGKLQTLKERK